MSRFSAAAERAGAAAPAGTSLKRMFAYWESGERAVTVPAYRRAFREIYESSDAALGFALEDGSERLSTLNRDRPLIVEADTELIDLLESQTDSLRELDRRLGSAAQALMVEAHVEQIEFVLHRSVGPHRRQVAQALAEAAALAGWQALDRADLTAAWEFHETAKGAAHESESAAVIAHVTAQQAFVLLDLDKPGLANDVIDQASEVAARVPPLLAAWLAAAKGEALAAAGDSHGARQSLDQAGALLPSSGSSEELPFLMLTPEHLARWRGHCLARLGDADAFDWLPMAISSEQDSVRAAVSLHADMALALMNGGFVPEALNEASRTLERAKQYGSARQQKRLLRILGIV